MENYSKDTQDVAKITEKLLQCLIYRLLRKLIVKESAEGYIEYSSIPKDLFKELKKEEEKCVDIETGNGIDNIVLHKIIEIVEDQAEYTLTKYHESFHQMVSQLELKKDTAIAYDTYVRIARKMFGADLTWYHVIALLCFGTEVALYVIREGWVEVKELLEQIVHFTIDFIIKEKIADWITSHGGWMAMLKFFDDDCSDRPHHILSIMAFYEITNFESFLRNLTAVAVVSGALLTLFHVVKYSKN